MKTILNIIVFIVLVFVFLLNISATTLSHIEHTNLKTAIQKKDVIIEALMISCEMDFLIKRIRGKE